MTDGPKLRLVIDGRSLFDNSALRGIGTYLRAVLSGLAQEPGFEVQALVRKGTTLPVGVAGHLVSRRAPGRYANQEHDFLLPGDLRRAGGDVVHSPALDPPRKCPAPWVQTLHDVIPLTFDDAGLAGERRRWEQIRGRFEHAAAVIAISRHVADGGMAALGLPPQRIHVVYHGVDEQFHAGVAATPQEEAPYVLMVSEYDPRKGYPEVLEVMGRLAAAGLPHQLKIAGFLAPWYEEKVRGLIAASPAPERVELLGYVDHHRDLPALYAGAGAVILSTRHEGFGLPALEAMAIGAPVVGFANTATTEVVADGGLLVEDGDVVALADATERVLRTPSLAAELRERGVARAGHFRWDRSVKEHADIFRAVAG